MRRKTRYCIIGWLIIALLAAITFGIVWVIFNSPYEVKQAVIRFDNAEHEFRVLWRRYDFRCWGSFYKENRIVGQTIEFGTYESIQKRDDVVWLEAGSARTWITADIDVSGFVSVLIDVIQRNISINLNAVGLNWYAGPQDNSQLYPVQRMNFENLPFVTTDERHVMERYWLASNGYFVLNDYSTPLFVNQMNQLTFRAERTSPFSVEDSNNQPPHQLRIGISDNMKTTHLNVINRLLGKPSGKPNIEWLKYPIWNPSVHYPNGVNSQIMRNYFNEIIDNGFRNGTIDFDGHWEDCRGSLNVDTVRYPDIRELIAHIKSNGFKVRFTIHPFVDSRCYIFADALDDDYFILSQSETHNDESYHIDFTNPQAFTWFYSRLRRLQIDLSIDSFKFDGGESNLIPDEPIIYGNDTLSPNIITKSYANLAAEFGGSASVGVGWGTQSLPLLIQMSQFDSSWETSRGIRSLIPRLLQLNMNGYVFALSDVIGGNSLQVAPYDLYLRWLQVSTFMPAIQLSYGPWEYNNQTITEWVRYFLNLREQHADLIESIIDEAIENGDPVNRPMWWIDPSDPVLRTIDDQYLLGDRILVAPFLEPGIGTRNVYLPTGLWKDGNTNTLRSGPYWERDYFAPLDALPYFIRMEE